MLRVSQYVVLSSQKFVSLEASYLCLSFMPSFLPSFKVLVQRSNQLSYEATDVESWSFVDSSVSVMNESMNEVIHETNHVLNCAYEIK